jgi:hypothetical protein
MSTDAAKGTDTALSSNAAEGANTTLGTNATPSSNVTPSTDDEHPWDKLSNSQVRIDHSGIGRQQPIGWCPCS